MTKFRFEMNSYDDYVSSVEEALPDLPEAKMKEELKKLAGGAFREWPDWIQKDAAIQACLAAIEKATAFYHTEILGLQQPYCRGCVTR